VDEKQRGEKMMFKLIGGAVVYGFALYGLANYLSWAKVEA
jgi:hypothetical protein